ncbi:hypothetical protein AGMMS49521_2200 [Campylobacterota bacterium]|nr:hypothetical protein AGMMS49521_2200 [Campylobacterota bacterium]
MYAVKAIYSENTFKLSEPIPFDEDYEVVITFTAPRKKSQENLLKFCGTWDTETAKSVLEIVQERETFSLNRPAI